MVACAAGAVWLFHASESRTAVQEVQEEVSPRSTDDATDDATDRATDHAVASSGLSQIRGTFWNREGRDVPVSLAQWEPILQAAQVTNIGHDVLLFKNRFLESRGLPTAILVAPARAPGDTERTFAELCFRAGLRVSCLYLRLGHPEFLDDPANLEPHLTEVPVAAVAEPGLALRTFRSIGLGPRAEGVYLFDCHGGLVWRSGYRAFTDAGREAAVVVATLLGSCQNIDVFPPSTPGAPEVVQQAPRRAEPAEPSSALADRLPGVHLSELPGRVYPMDSGQGVAFRDSWAARHVAQRQSPMLISFWATWCTPCIAELPELNQLRNQFADVLFVGLANDNTRTPEQLAETRNQMRDHLSGYDLDIQYILDDLEVPRALFPEAIRETADLPLPAFALFDSQGNLTHRQLGAIKDPEEYAALESQLHAVSESP